MGEYIIVKHVVVPHTTALQQLVKDRSEQEERRVPLTDAELEHIVETMAPLRGGEWVATMVDLPRRVAPTERPLNDGEWEAIRAGVEQRANQVVKETIMTVVKLLKGNMVARLDATFEVEKLLHAIIDGPDRKTGCACQHLADQALAILKK
jgi:hypothetical protein